MSHTRLTKKVIHPTLIFLLLCSYGHAQKEERFLIDRYDIQGIDQLAPEERFMLESRLNGQYTGPDKTLGDIYQAKDELDAQLSRILGRKKYNIHLPEQTLSGGKVTLQLVPIHTRILSKVIIHPTKAFHTDLPSI